MQSFKIQFRNNLAKRVAPPGNSKADCSAWCWIMQKHWGGRWSPDPLPSLAIYCCSSQTPQAEFQYVQPLMQFSKTIPDQFLNFTRVKCPGVSPFACSKCAGSFLLNFSITTHPKTINRKTRDHPEPNNKMPVPETLKKQNSFSLPTPNAVPRLPAQNSHFPTPPPHTL